MITAIEAKILADETFGKLQEADNRRLDEFFENACEKIREAAEKGQYWTRISVPDGMLKTYCYDKAKQRVIEYFEEQGFRAIASNNDFAVRVYWD